MTLRKFLLWFLLIDFALFSAWVMWEVGYLGIWQAGFTSPGSMQILADLGVACLLIMSWIFADARARGLNPWPWMVATLAIGSLAPLLYLLIREYSNVRQRRDTLVSAA